LAGQLVKILCYTDLQVDPRDLFWHRDLGLLTKAFRKLGHNAWLVVHPAGESTRHPPLVTRQDPVIWASPADVRSPSWWQSHQPDLVIFGLWTRPKYDSIRRAALSATPRIIERADSDGMRTASCGLISYLKRRYDFCRDLLGKAPLGVATLAALGYAAACVAATPWMERRLSRTLKLLPALTVETPTALSLWRGLASRIGGIPSRVHLVPHPVQSRLFELRGRLKKRNRIIAVGRWRSYQKNFPRLLMLLRGFLPNHPDWSALVVGIGKPAGFHQPRLSFLPSLSPPRLASQMKASRVLLFTSRYEGCLLAGAEALLAGCAVIGPKEVSCSSFYRSFCKYSPVLLSKNGLVLAGDRPADFGFRSLQPQVLLAKRVFSPEAVARKMLRIARCLGVSTCKD
jgi:glycosyltransferase involved in cell wall biosynthesis